MEDTVQSWCNQATPLVRVVGTGRADFAPDRLRLTLTAEAIHNSATEAQASSSKVMTGIVRILADAGVDSRDMATIRYSLGPHYEIDDGPFPRRTKSEGFEAQNTIVVTVRNPGDAGRIMDLAVKAGATTLELNYDYAVPAEARALARERAVTDAHNKALHLAELAGVRLGEPVYIEESERPWAVHGLTVAGLPMAVTPTPVNVSELRIELTVEIAYHLVRDWYQR